MNELIQRKYNICGALERITKGEKFAFSDYLTEAELDKFQDYKKTFKHIGNFTYENRANLSEDTEFLIESMLFYEYAHPGIDFFVLRSSGLNNSNVAFHHSDLGSYLRKKFNKEDRDAFKNKIPKEVEDLLMQINLDFDFCNGIKNTNAFAFILNRSNTPYWHVDETRSLSIRAAIAPVGPHTIYSNTSVEEANLLGKQNSNIFIPSSKQISFHLYSSCNKFSREVQDPFRYASYKCSQFGDIEGAVHKSPDLDKNLNSLERIYIELPLYEFKDFTHLTNHLDNLKEELIEAYDIPDYEFNWYNVSFYENKSLHLLTIDEL